MKIQRTFTVCDICNREDNLISIPLYYGANPYSEMSKDSIKTIDLCPRCQKDVLNFIEQRKELLEFSDGNVNE